MDAEVLGSVTSAARAVADSHSVDWTMVVAVASLIAGVVGAAAAVIAVWPKRARAEGPAPLLDQRHQQINVAEVRFAYERAHVSGVDPEQLAHAEALFTSMPTDTIPERSALPAGSRMLMAPNPIFVGRSEDLRAMAAAFGRGDTVALGQVVAATGLGGLGKTQLAVEFVHRYGRFFAGGVFWLSFTTPAEITLQVAACAGPGAMGLAASLDGLSLEEQQGLVMGAWQSPLPRLLVFDNCEEESLLDAWRPPTGGCRLLVTSRRSHWSPALGVHTLPLDVLPRRDSIELLHRHRPDLPVDDPGLDAIAEALGDLPLALHLAGSYLAAYRHEVSLTGYLAELSRPAVLQHASLLGRGLEDTPSPTRHVPSLAKTFAVSLDRLQRTTECDRVAIALLARMACMAPGEPVPRELLAATLPDVDALVRADGLRRLSALGLTDEGEGWLRLHRLVVHFVRQASLDAAAPAAVDWALMAAGHAAAEADLTGTALLTVIPHLVAAAEGHESDAPERTAVLANAAGHALRRASLLAAARPLYERALAIDERVLGPDHPDTANSLNSLAGLLQDQGELAAARPLYERALAICEWTLGPDHPDTANNLNSLAGLLQDQGELAAARPLYERALAIRERTLGPDHPDTANSLNHLALLLRDQGELAAAWPLLERALAICERALGPDHPGTANSLNNLALLLRDRGDLVAARPLYERALAICERTLGPDHPETAPCLNNLAGLLRAQGDLAAARPLYERALAIRERALGPDHPDTASSLNSLAGLLHEQGELAAAWPLLERALAIRERALGPDHHYTANSLSNLAGLLRDQGDLAAARPLYERALAICERTLGPDHPDTAVVRRNLDNGSRHERSAGDT